MRAAAERGLRAAGLAPALRSAAARGLRAAGLAPALRSSAAPAAVSAASVGSKVRGAAALRRLAVARGLRAAAPDFAVGLRPFSLPAAAGEAGGREGRFPIRAGRSAGSPPSTPGGSDFAFAVFFLGLSTIGLRV